MQKMLIEYNKYKKAEPKEWLIFLRSWQDRIEPELAGRLAYLASLRNVKLHISYGFRSYEEQVEVVQNTLKVHPDYYRKPNGAVYNKKGRCMVAAPGNSSHNCGFAIDAPKTWIEKMNNKELKAFGLYKPMSYEPWHVQILETAGASMKEKYDAFYKYMGGGNYPMDVKTFQMITGLKPDNIPGPKTKAKAKEMLLLLHSILGTDFKTPEETIKATQNQPDLWLSKLNEIENFNYFVMNIVNKMKGL